MSPNAASNDAKLIVLSAPSGTGKSTLASMLLSRHSNIRLSISYTTRAPRGEEKHGQHYFFVSEDEFKAMIGRGEFLEHARVFDKYYYGTSRRTVEGMLAAGHHVLFDIDVQGADQLKAAFKERCVTVFLLPPSFQELEARLRNRKTETPEAIQTRLNTAKEELQAAPRFDHRIVNNDLNATFKELESVLKKERCI